MAVRSVLDPGLLTDKAVARRVAGVSVDGVMRVYLLRQSPAPIGNTWGWLPYGFSFDYQSRTGA